jgi:outer membrane protein assembly factor BamB
MTVKSMRRRAPILLAVAAALSLSGCSLLNRGGDNKPKTPTVGNRVPVLTTQTSVAVDPSISGLSVILPEPAPNAAWSQPGGNSAKSMGHPALAASPAMIWSAKIDAGNKRARLAASPIIVDDKLFVMDVSANVHAFNASTGAKIWSISLGSTNKDGRTSEFGGGVSSDGTRLYATNGVGDVAALELADGKQIWRVSPGVPLRGSPTVAFGNVYAMSQDNQMFALSAATGEQVWKAAGSVEAGSVFGAAAPAAGQGTVVSGFSTGELGAYRYENGRELWNDALSRTGVSVSVSTLTDIDASPVIDRGRVFAVGRAGRMAAYELLSSQRLWELNIGGTSTPWVAGEWLFVVTDDARLICIARATGKLRWVTQMTRYRNEKKKTDPIRWVGPVLAGGRLWVGSSEGELVEANPADGSTLQTRDMKQAITLPPIVANSTLYILDDSGRITAWR